MAAKEIKILVFTEGTIIMHENALGHSREEIVQQVKENDESIHDFESYIQIGNAVNKLKTWIGQGAEIMYLTSRTNHKEIEDVKHVLIKHGFPFGHLHFRKENEKYSDVAERIVPDVLIEDDCESIGGIDEMTITLVKPEIKKRIISLVIREFEGVDHLPDDIQELLNV